MFTSAKRPPLNVDHTDLMWCIQSFDKNVTLIHSLDLLKILFHVDLEKSPYLTLSYRKI